MRNTKASISEAAAVLSMYFDLPLPSPEELGVPESYYVLGMADAVGEMRRTALELLRKGKKEEAESISDHGGGV
jgi:translin